MKTAVILHGNLRTFFMPLREDRGLRICDLVLSNIVKPNNADLFLVTDVTDFYHDGVQYCSPGHALQARNYRVVDLMDPVESRRILSSELGSFFGGLVKEMIIIDPINIAEDAKFVLLSSANTLSTKTHKAGCIPEGLVNQYYKIKLAYDSLRRYEELHSVRYDLVFRGRFDLMYGRSPLNLNSFDYSANDVYVPGPGGDAPIIYDWAAFGTRRAMDLALCLYDQLGFTLANRLYRCECGRCGRVFVGGMEKCCGEMEYEEMSLSSEYHLYRLFKDNGVRYAVANGCSMTPYRYS